MSRARDLARFANNQALSVSSDLNVGINSTSPDGKLDVIGDVDVSGIITAITGSFVNAILPDERSDSMKSEDPADTVRFLGVLNTWNNGLV